MHHQYCKSSGEELVQDFSSLHAQCEACEAYIKAEADEDGGLVKTAYAYDDLSSGIMSVRIGRPSNAIAILASASTPATVQSASQLV